VVLCTVAATPASTGFAAARADAPATLRHATEKKKTATPAPPMQCLPRPRQNGHGGTRQNKRRQLIHRDRRKKSHRNRRKSRHRPSLRSRRRNQIAIANPNPPSALLVTTG
jgi:hypothetical protein